MDWEFYFKAFLMLCAAVFAVCVLFYSCKSDIAHKEIQKKCEESCKISRSMLIFGGCHCATPTGWEKVN